MLHSNRLWSIQSVASKEDLAAKLTEFTWTGCTAFQLGNHLYVNDATSGDGAQEYAVLLGDRSTQELVQIESITFSWCSYDEAFRYIERISSGEFDHFHYGWVSRRRFQTAARHGHCPLCV